MATSSTTGQGLIQSLGIGSGLDIKSLVTQLVAADRAPMDSRIARQTQSVATQLSAMGALKGALSGFQSALTPLATGANFQAMSAAGRTIAGHCVAVPAPVCRYTLRSSSERCSS